MEDFIEHYDVAQLGTDEEYEFDACRFFDFTRPELDWEIEEAERWFEVSGNYPLSPFVVKLNLDKLLSVEALPSSSNRNYNITKPIICNSDIRSRNGVSTQKKNVEILYQPKSSTLMKPTASHLAKQNKTHNTRSIHVCTRFQRTSVKIDQKGSQSPTLSDNPATKRQKLDIGYLKKIAELKHRVSLSHKSSKKLTIPKEPELETLLRAQRRSSKNSSISSEIERQKQKESNANRKAPLLSQPNKSKPQVSKTQEFQVFHLKTAERAKHRAFGKVLSTVNTVAESPPIEQFSKLSLRSDSKANEDGLGSVQPESRK